MNINVNGTDIFYEKYATDESAPPLLMLHGNGETHAIFDKAAPLLAERFTVYALDSRGHGQSAPVGEFHYDEMAADVLEFIDALHLERPVLYGFSDGAIIGLLVALARPRLLSALIISGANIEPEGIRESWMKLFRFIYKKTGEPKMKMMFDEPHIPPSALAAITVPVTVLAGSRDMVRRAHTRLIARSIPGSTLKILHPYGHGGYIVHSKRIARLIMEAVEFGEPCR